MKKIWMRVGMETLISDEEYNELCSSKDSYRLYGIFKSMIERGVPFGETYIVGQKYGNVENYDNPEEEISFWI